MTKQRPAPRPLSREQRRVAFAQMADERFNALEEWYDQHPAASFGELEAEARRQRRELMGAALTLLVNGRTSGYQLKALPCPQCAQPMQFEGYREWTVSGLEGESTLQRAYYVCPHCHGETVFPPGSATPPARGSLE